MQTDNAREFIIYLFYYVLWYSFGKWNLELKSLNAHASWKEPVAEIFHIVCIPNIIIALFFFYYNYITFIESSFIFSSNIYLNEISTSTKGNEIFWTRAVCLKFGQIYFILKYYVSKLIKFGFLALIDLKINPIVSSLSGNNFTTHFVRVDYHRSRSRIPLQRER